MTTLLDLKTVTPVSSGLTDDTVLFGAVGGIADASPEPITLPAVADAVAELVELTGDVTKAAGSAATTLATVNGNVGSFGSVSAVATFTVNAKGLITAAGSSAIQIAISAVTGLQAALDAKQPLDSDLTAIAGLTTTAFGRSFLEYSNEAAFKAGVNLEEGADFLSPASVGALIAATAQPLDADLTAIAALSTTAAGRSVLTATDPNADRLVGWKDSDGAIKPLALADIADEAAPASGDKLVIYGAEGDIRKIDWDDLPGAGGGISAVVEDTSPQLGGNLDANGNNVLFDDFTGIYDENGNEVETFYKTASAVNFFRKTNAATGGNPKLEAEGSDSDVGIDLVPKGTGALRRGTKTVLDQGRGATLDAAFGVAATSVNDGTKSSGTFTPAFADGNVRRYLNNGAHTLAPPTGEGTMVIQITNDSSAGAITTSGFTKKTGDAFTTTNGHDFLCNIQVVNGFSLLHVTAMQ